MKKAKELKTFRNSVKLLRLGMRFSKEFFVWKLIWVVVKAARTVLVDILLLKFVLDAITEGKTFGETIGFVLLCVSFSFAEMYINDWVNTYIQPIAKNKIHKSVHQMIFGKICTIDLEKFDDCSFYDKYIWTLEKASDQMMLCMENYMKLIASIISMISIAAIICTASPVVILFSVVPMIFVSFFGKKINRIEYACEQEVNPVSRRKNYSRRVFYLKEYVQDIRSSEIKNVMMNNFEESADKEIAIQKKYAKQKMAATSIKDSGYGFAQGLGLYLYIVYKAIVEKSFTAGTCASIINAVDRLSGYFYQFTFSLLAVQKNGLYAEDFFEFLKCNSVIEAQETEIQETETQGTENLEAGNQVIPALESIKIENLSFQYCNTDKWALKNINMSIRKGEKIAIVGYNGAGKSTLIKLLLRFYDSQAGAIFYNGQNIKGFSARQYRKKFSTIFQNFQIYAATLLENIVMNIGTSEEEKAKALACLKRTKLDVGQEDLLKSITKEFDEKGLEFSGGQRQKVAIARALYTDGDFVIMDEASSALDPIAENEINQLILNTMINKTILIITHRLSTVKHVDKIYFMENGEIVESGTHEELMGLNGKYAEMYSVQARQYSHV